MKIVSVLWASALSLSLAGCASMGGEGGSTPSVDIAAAPSVDIAAAPSVDIADGDAAAARSQHGIAIEHYTRAIASKRLGAPEMLEVYTKRAESYLMQSDANGGVEANLIAALEDYSRVRAAAPNFMPAAMGEAHAYQGLGAFNEALDRKSTRLNSSHLGISY